MRIDGKRVPIEEALEMMTDEWLQKEKEKYSWVTVKNLRDIVKEYQILVEYLEERNKLDKKEFDEKLVIAEKFNKEWRKYNPDYFEWNTDEQGQ
jgi:hypothetical protein